MADEIVARDGFGLPLSECGEAGGRRAQETAAAEAATFLNLAADKTAALEAVKSGIDCARTVAEGAHGGSGKNLAEVVSGTRLLAEQRKQDVFEEGKPLHST